MKVEIVYGNAQQQVLVALEVTATATSVRAALQQARLEDSIIPELCVGIFSHLVHLDTILKQDDHSIATVPTFGK